MSRYQKTISAIFLFSFLTSNLFAHKNFWEIKATALPNEESISFNLMFSLDQLKEFFDDRLELSEYKPAEKDTIIEILVPLVNELISIKQSGKKLTPFVKNVNLFIDEALAQEKSLSLSSVDIDIELIFFTNEPELEGQWNIYADSLVKEKGVDLSSLPEGALDVNIYFLDEASSKFTVNTSKKNFTWKRTAVAKLKALNSVPITKTIESSAIYLPLILILFALITWSFTNSNIFNLLSIVLISLSILSFTTPIFNQSKIVISQTLPKEGVIKSFMSKALQKMYISSTSVNNDLKWKTLSEISTDNFREQMFISNFSNKDKKITHFVESVQIDSIRQISENEIECSWNTNALFQHISHIHEKTMSFKAVFHFEAVDNTWLINDMNIRRQL